MSKSAQDAVGVRVTKAIDMFRRSLTVDDPDPMFFNNLFFTAGELEISMRRLKARLEAGRKSTQFEIRDDLIQNAAATGNQISRSAAEDQAKADPRYLAYIEQIEGVTALCEQAQLLKETARQRAELALEERKWKRAQLSKDEALSLLSEGAS